MTQRQTKLIENYIRKIVRKTLKENSMPEIEKFIDDANPLKLFYTLQKLGIRIYSGVSNFNQDSDKGKDRFKTYMNRGIEAGDFTEEDVVNAFKEINRRYR